MKKYKAEIRDIRDNTIVVSLEADDIFSLDNKIAELGYTGCDRNMYFSNREVVYFKDGKELSDIDLYNELANI